MAGILEDRRFSRCDSHHRSHRGAGILFGVRGDPVTEQATTTPAPVEPQPVQNTEEKGVEEAAEQPGEAGDDPAARYLNAFRSHSIDG